MLRFFTSFLVSLLLTFSLGLAQESPGTAAEANGPSSVDLLIDVIEDDAARTELIERLRATGIADDTPPSEEIVDTLARGEAPPDNLSFGRQIALITQAAAEDISAWATGFWAQLTRAPDVFDGLSGDEVSVLIGALSELALVIASTVIAFVVLRWFGKSLYARMSASARDGGMARTAMLFVMSALIDAVIVVIAWAAGYALAILAIGDFGQIGIRQTLYLNAFLLVEMAKVVVRLVLSPSATSLRPLPISDLAAAYLSARINLIVGVVGYAQLLIVPILNSNISFAAGRAVSALVAFAVLAFAIGLVLRNRKPVADWLLGGQEPAVTTPDPVAGMNEPVAVDPVQTAVPDQTALPRRRRRRGALEYLARHWHWPMLAYLLAMFVIVLLRPGNAVFQAFATSGQVVIVGLLGFATSGFISRVMARGVILPPELSQRVPLLQGRLNAFVPKTLLIVRALIFLLVVLVAVNAIGLIDLRAWMVSQFGLRLTGMILSVSLVLLISFGIWLALSSWLDYRLNPEFGSVPTARERTLLTLLRNAATIALIVITVMFVLAEVGLDIAPLLASACESACKSDPLGWVMII
ncbi:mechanosensitive ion channel protein MscS [Lacimonas salitolerans]|uniref:Mechanosensitive ion channel protein MscS n=1 Tax=Lacimonas salitolerans TaxID=1323750 RepID=A0ABW4ELU5_9RHOB